MSFFRSFLWVSLLVTSLTSHLVSQDKKGGINFFHGKFEEALAQAKKENKLIFMDAFTTWCGPCKRMSASVFPDPAVGEYYNANFINIKVDMEKTEGPSLAGKYAVASYPTLLYIDGDGKVIHRTAGARPADAFIELGKEALKKYDRSAEFEKKYNAGQRDPETILNYIRTLNQVGKPSLKIANEYLASQSQLNTKENLHIIFEAATEADSKIFEYLVQYKDEFIALKTKDSYETKIYNCCSRTFKKALEYRNTSLLKEAQDKMKAVPSKHEAFKYQTDLEYAGTTGDAKTFLSTAKSYQSNVVKNDASKMQELSLYCLKFFRDDKSVMSYAEKIAKKAMENGGQTVQYLNYANILKANNKHKEAFDIANQAIENAKLKGEPTQSIDYFIRDLNLN
ncbi:MAG: thioredoxin family protein [Bacteroidota bacterium]|nr:thioredoxin family protein [Bacteroidota bacterium]